MYLCSLFKPNFYFPTDFTDAVTTTKPTTTTTTTTTTTPLPTTAEEEQTTVTTVTEEAGGATTQPGKESPVVDDKDAAAKKNGMEPMAEWLRHWTQDQGVWVPLKFKSSFSSTKYASLGAV